MEVLEAVLLLSRILSTVLLRFTSTALGHG